MAKVKKLDRNWIMSPSNFNVEDYPGPIQQNELAARWILHIIFYKSVAINRGGADWVNLKTEFLQNIIGKRVNFAPIRDELENYGFILVNRKYKTGGFSMSYKLGPKANVEDWSRWTTKGKVFANKTEIVKALINEAGNEFDTEVDNHLKLWMGRITLPDNLNDLFESLAHNPKRQWIAIHQANFFRYGYRPYKRCPHGRAHHAISVMVREARKRLIVKSTGEQMISLDVANSQPYFLLKLLPEIFDRYYREYRDRDREERIIHHMIPPFLPENSTQVYMEKVLNGSFGSDFKNIPHLDPTKLKKYLFIILFGDEEDMENSPLTCKFKELYAEVFQTLKDLKIELGKVDYNRVAHVLQKYESDAIIEGVVGRLARDYPEVPVATVHDNILTTEAHEDLIRRLMLEECEKIVGLRPTIRKD